MVNYNKLYYFYIITLRGSMNQAAQQLYISQPALSKSVKDLEAFFGVSLFDREKRNFMLTPAGETLRRECVRIFSGEEHLLHQMRQFQDDTQKTLRFGYMIYKEIYEMQEVFSRFEKEYPNVHLKAKSYIERTTLTADLMAGKIDVGLKLFTLEDVIPELDYRILEESHLAVIMNENHPFAERKELHMSELAGEKFVFLGKNSSSSEYNYTREWCQRCGFEPNIVECFDHVGMVLMMVKSGFGITILSDLAPVDHMTGLVTVPLVNAPVFCSGLFWRKDRVDLGTIQFVDYYCSVVKDRHS